MLTASAIICVTFINLCNRLTFCITGKSTAVYRTGIIILGLCKTKGKYKGGYFQMNSSFYSLSKLAVCPILGSLFYTGHIENEKWVLDGSTCARDRTIVPAVQFARSDPQ